MKYIVRAVKYFVYLCIVLVLFIVILQLLHLVEGNIEQMFVNGYDSIWQMAIIVAVFAAVYPRLGYSSRNVRIGGESSAIEPRIVDYMHERGYILKNKEGENLYFKKASLFTRIVKMGEDGVTFTRQFGGYSIEGLTKEIIRIDTGLTHLFNNGTDEQ